MSEIEKENDPEEKKVVVIDPAFKDIKFEDPCFFCWRIMVD